MQRIQQANQDIGPQHDQRPHTDPAASHPAPGRAQVLAAARQPGEGQRQTQQQKDQGIGDKDDGIPTSSS